MGTLLAALLDKTKIRWFFSGVTVELPAYFLPNFKVVEVSGVKQLPRGCSPTSHCSSH